MPVTGFCSNEQRHLFTKMKEDNIMSVLDNKPVPYLKTSFGLNFRIGLVVSLGLCIMAFKITIPSEAEKLTGSLEIDESTIIVEPAPPRTKTNAPKPPKKIAAPTVKPVQLFNPVVSSKPLPEPDASLFDVPDETPIDEPPVTYIKKPEKPVTWAEQMPEFTGNLEEYLSQVPYCAWAKEVDIEGTVMASFVVNEQGEVTDVKIERSLFPCIDEDVKEHLQNMPAWVPGKMQGHAVKVRMGVPIKFRLN